MRLGRRLAADVLNARRLDDPPNVTSRSVPGAVRPCTLSDRDERARWIAVEVSNTHAFDEFGHAEGSAEWVPKGQGVASARYMRLHLFRPAVHAI